MPFLNKELLHYIIMLSSGYDAVIPCLDNGKIEPLHAVYSRVCLDIVRELLEGKDWKIASLLDRLKVRYVSEEECYKYDPELLSFFNINNRKELKEAEVIASGIKMKSGT